MLQACPLCLPEDVIGVQFVSFVLCSYFEEGKGSVSWGAHACGVSYLLPSSRALGVKPRHSGPHYQVVNIFTN